MATAQQTDPKVSELQPSISSLQLQILPLPTSDLTLLCDMSTEVPTPYISQQFWQAVFDSLPFLHPSICATQNLNMSGLISTKMYMTGLGVVYSVRHLKFGNAPQHHFANWKHLTPYLSIYTLTSFAPFHLPEDMFTYWLVLTDSPNDQKLCLL